MQGLKLWVMAGVFLAGVVAGGAGAVGTYEKLIIPAREARLEARVTKSVTEMQQIICRDTTTIAAAAAQEAARRRQRQVGELALDAARAAAVTREARRVAQIEELEQENARYAQQLVTEGRSCPLDLPDIEWLRRPATNASR